MLKKILVWGCIAFVLFFVAFRPGTAATALKGIIDMIGSIFLGLADFFRGLF